MIRARSYVLHRGKIGGGKKGVGLALFRNNFVGKWTSVEGDEVVSIGAIASADFITQVSSFVKEVDRIKPKK
jgi:hypothetical protein